MSQSHSKKYSLNTEEKARKKEIIEMKQKAVFSLAWMIADSRCYMVILQIIVIALCGYNIFLSYSQFGNTPFVISTHNFTDAKCDANHRFYGPYLGRASNGKLYGCPWPQINSIVRFASAGIGLLAAIITIILQICLGKKVLYDIKTFNETRQDGKQIEYFDIYSHCCFRLIRKLIGYAAYLQFISFGLDLNSYFVGRETATQLNISNQLTDFERVLFIAVPAAILLRLSHDSMYQRLWKGGYGFQFKFKFKQNKEFQGPTFKEKNQNDYSLLNVEPGAK